MKVDCLVLKVGIRGIDNQSIALAKHLGINYKVMNINVNPLLKYFPVLGNLFGKYFYNSFKILENYKFKFIITTGKRLSGVSVVLKQKYNKKIINLHIQKPPFLSHNFDVLVIPEHDNFNPINFNVKIIGSLSFFKEEEVKKNFQPIKTIFKNFRSPNILLLLGGKNKRYSPTFTDYTNLMLNVKKSAEQISGNVIICPSRRTCIKVLYLASLIFNNFKFKKYIHSNEKTDIYPGILNISDYVIVTSDSVNMISEIASTSNNLFIAKFKKNDLKLNKFHEKIVDLGFGKIFNNNLKKFKKNRLDNVKTVQREIIPILKLLSK